MPFKSSNSNVTITEQQLAPHLRSRFSTNGATSSISNGSDYKGTLGELVTEGDAVGIVNGLYYKANTAIACVAIAVESGISGSLILLRDSRIYESERYNFEPGCFVWLGDGVMNMNTDIPSFALGSTIQQIGIAETETRLKIEIKDKRVVR